VFCEGENSTRLEWEIDGNNDLVKLGAERSRNGDDFSPIATFDPGSQTLFRFSDPLSVQEATYYRLAMISSDGKSSWSDVQGISGGSCRQSENFFSLFPNPASDELLISLRGSGEATLSLFDTQGRIVRTPESKQVYGLETILWNLSDLAPGLYTVFCSSNGLRSFQKLVVQ
jgi:hypothetical protein